MKLRCPICNKPLPPSRKDRLNRPGNAKYFPFCSQRCKLIDLGAWFDGEYMMPDNSNDTEAKGTDVAS